MRRVKVLINRGNFAVDSEVGFFHGFFADSFQDNAGILNFTVGLVEFTNGRVEKFAPDQFIFVDPYKATPLRPVVGVVIDSHFNEHWVQGHFHGMFLVQEKGVATSMAMVEQENGQVIMIHPNNVKFLNPTKPLTDEPSTK